ncbi:trehalose/maltose hydrolase-like predicted phosphorylase [Enterococcus sp. PF1-24]|uniref:glycoside hydrolase family 65 protein n=1 Tax=unclassified Enterococcus TaxID=2608891 RepID=UPI0024736E29|nr:MULTISPECIES: glycosyl hydrolase family 65 protein [unclassified Enterococcus]MDH6363772.1 trehalose/maltose hydrolase-like predicted phosphorylase [Enterococcus sp. PFB1-1]MDH6400728.1 trehalose/maltose hydrolase-like predicted phosphorylase [Enterococcus sp. PF1-24]
MNLIKLSKEAGRFLLVSERENFSFQEDQVGEVIEKLQTTEENYAGILAILATDSQEKLQTSFKQVAKTFSEKLNLPLVITENADFAEATFFEAAEKNSWTFDYYGYAASKDEYSVESLLTTGNGFIGLRGTTPEMMISDDCYPATYLAGLYNEAVSEVEGQAITNEDFVNAPNLQYLTVVVDGEKITFAKEQVKELSRSLNTKTGLLTSEGILATATGKEMLITTEKFVSMANRHQYGLTYQITPLNFQGEIEIISEADGEVYNYNVARYRSLNSQHLTIEETIANKNQARLVAKTKQSQMQIIQESKLLSSQALQWENQVTATKVIQRARAFVTPNQPVKVEKLVFIDLVTDELEAAAISGVAELNDFATMLQASVVEWQKLWQTVQIQVAGDSMSQKMLNLHTYHLLVSGSPLAAGDLDASTTARGLHGEAYRGHIFWDELFILPFYILHFPETAKALLMYRYQRLAAAKSAAKEIGFEGAMFPWQSGVDGSEQSQALHLNPINGEWDEDHSRLQRHVSLAIAYNVWLYFENTHDLAFMEAYGLELLLEIAKFWLSIATYDENTHRYSIAGVMGPDEFHEAYPYAEKGGLKDNAYTNMMVVWLFEELQKLLTELTPQVLTNVQEKTNFTTELIAKMNQMMHQLHLEINQEGIIAQYEGYLDLKEVDWDYYREKYGDVYRMDRLLRAEGETADAYQVTKQADSLMIFYNFDKQRIDRILKDLGYQLPTDYLEKNLDYYLARTSHGSTLSRVVHGQLATMVNNKELSWQLYQEALYSDYQDIQGGTTAEGIHAGVMAATLYITLTTYGGLDIRQKELHFRPNLPEQWQGLTFKFVRNGVDYQVALTKEAFKIKANQDSKIFVMEEEFELLADTWQTITLK